MRGISVIVCCYNSALRLEQTLFHLANQKFSKPINWEVILVNNASTDNTVEIATIGWKKHFCESANFRIVEQPISGLSNARKKGVDVAKFDIIVFCDDDNWLQEEYLEIAYDIMTEKPDVGALGGNGIGVADVEFPEWWDDYKGDYAVGKQAEGSGYINSRGYVWGAGMVTRKKLFLKCFTAIYPSLLTGRNGEILSSGDDSEFCFRLLLLNYDLYYEEKLLFTHYITENRLTLDYNEKLLKGHLDAYSILYKYKKILDFKNKNFIQKCIHLLKICRQLVEKCLSRTGANKMRIMEELYLNLKFDFIPCDIDYKKILRFRKAAMKS